jgi:hypothetical protein
MLIKIVTHVTRSQDHKNLTRIHSTVTCVWEHGLILDEVACGLILPPGRMRSHAAMQIPSFAARQALIISAGFVFAIDLMLRVLTRKSIVTILDWPAFQFLYKGHQQIIIGTAITSLLPVHLPV